MAKYTGHDELGKKKMFYIFSPFLRFFHWIMVICILVLFFTGLYIGDPGWGGLVGSEPTVAVGSFFSMETIRLVHFVAAVTLTVSCILRIYDFIINRSGRLLPHFWEKQYWSDMWYQLKHYLMVPMKEERRFMRNPLARTSYALLYVLLLIMILTGFAMFAQIDPNSVLASMFNWINMIFTEYQVHFIHHIVAWIIIIFVIAHVYMAFRSEFTERAGEVSSMFDGVKYLDVIPRDMSDVFPTNKQKRAAKRGAQVKASSKE